MRLEELRSQMESLSVHTVWGVGFDFRSFVGAYDLAKMKMVELARLVKEPTLTKVFEQDLATAWPASSGQRERAGKHDDEGDRRCGGLRPGPARSPD